MRRRARGNALRVVLRCMAAGGAVGAGAGAVWGFVRGLAYLPTLPVAIIEGAILLGVPAALSGLVVGGVAAVAGSVLRFRHR